MLAREGPLATAPCAHAPDPPPAQNVLDKRTPSNPKYRNVTSKLNTGRNMRKILQTYEGSGPNAHKRPADEYFQRLRPSTLGQLLQPAVEAEESIYRLDREDTASVVSTIVESTATGAAVDSNILIFDLRPFARFDECHVYGALQYDARELNKSTNHFPKEIYFYKGPAEGDKMIVLYDEDGKTSPAVANSFVERGIENTYVLSGGFLGACAGCPQLLMGTPPNPDDLPALMQRAGMKPALSTTGSIAGGPPGTARSVAGSACSVRTQQTSLSAFGGSVAGGGTARPSWR